MVSVYDEIISQVCDIYTNIVSNDDLEEALKCFDKFEEEYLNVRRNTKDQNDKIPQTTLQSINEDDGESNKAPEPAKTIADSEEKQNDKGKKRLSKKRSKEEVDGMSSPEPDKRSKRNASVKAQSIISKQVNVSLNQKMRREEPEEGKSRRYKAGDKENTAPALNVQIKQEKVSLPPEPMDTDSLSLNIDIKQERNKDESAMPPPAAPVPKPRRNVRKEKSDNEEGSDSVGEGARRSSARARKQADTVPPPDNPPPPPPAPVMSTRATRASARASSRNTVLSETMPPPPVPEAPAPRPKRTRGRKKASEISTDVDKGSSLEEIGAASPAEKPRPKKTRRGKNAEKQAEKPEEPQVLKETTNTTLAREKETVETQVPKEAMYTPAAKEKEIINETAAGKNETIAPQIQLKEDRLSKPDSPVIQKPKNKIEKKDKIEKKGGRNKAGKAKEVDDSVQSEILTTQTSEEPEPTEPVVADEPRPVPLNVNLNATVTINRDLDTTVVLPNGVYNHAPVTPQAVRAINETVVLEKCVRETMVLETHTVNDATMVIQTDKQNNLTDDNDNSLLTDDASEHEVVPAPQSPSKPVVLQQPSSAVKEKVQRFEELAARTTRTNTRALAKMQDEAEENQTPPDKMLKPALSQETLAKMNKMIFNGKPQPQISSSASKLRAVPSSKPQQPASASKLSALHRQKEAADKEREDARKKKEAMLEAKREQQRKKREEKMANAAAARSAAERERRLALEALARERVEKQQHADLGKLERLREVERRKLEMARKVAETEERRRAEEAARAQRLAEDQRRADLARRQLQEADAIKKEAALMAKEIEKKKKEYLEKQKLKNRIEMGKMHTPLKGMSGVCYSPPAPVHMADGFQYLNSDEDEEPVRRPHPAWCTPKAQKQTLAIQSLVSQCLIDKLFSVRVHSPDLREIFPTIERARLKRTSSAVWRTPPAIEKLPTLAE